jgi:hypothetical protein
MQKDEIIKKLNEIPLGDSNNNPVLWDTIDDFLVVPKSIKQDADIMEAITRIVSRRADEALRTLEAQPQNPDDEESEPAVWEELLDAWQNIDFSDIQTIINEAEKED